MSKVAIVTYKIKEEKVSENKDFILKVFEKLQENSPEGITYASVISDDNQTFTHIAYMKDDSANKSLTELAEFKDFQASLKDRCITPPNVTFHQVVGSFNFT